MEQIDKINLSKFRMDKSKEELDVSKLLLDNSKYADSINRSYYAIFHALRAVCALDGYDSSRHSGILQHFSYAYLRNEKMDRSLGRIANIAFTVRNKSDYDDFYIATKEEAEQQHADAEFLVNYIEKYLEKEYTLTNEKKKSKDDYERD